MGDTSHGVRTAGGGGAFFHYWDKQWTRKSQLQLWAKLWCCGGRGDAKGRQELVHWKKPTWLGYKEEDMVKDAVIETDCGCFPFGPCLLPMSILIWFEMVANSFGQDIQWEMLRFPPWREFIHNLKRGPHFQTISLSLSGPTLAITQPLGQGLSGEESIKETKEERGWSLGGA